MEMEGPWDLSVSEPENKYLFNGKERDSDFGLNWDHYGARMYDGAIGRFTGVDPIADEFAHLSVYNYADNSPISNIDLHGLQASTAIFGWLLSQAAGNPGGAAAATLGAADGASKSVGNFASGVASIVTDPVGTAKGVAKLNTLEGQVEMAIAVGTEAAERIDDVQNGSTAEAASAIAETVVDVAIIAAGTKGAGGSAKATGVIPKGPGAMGVGRVPAGETWINTTTKGYQKGGTKLSKTGSYIKSKLLKENSKTDFSKTTTSRGTPFTPEVKPVAKSRWAKVMDLLGGAFDDPRH